jgi:hypothetical protein
MTTLELLADQLKYIAKKIKEIDRMGSCDDAQCGVIEGKLAAYRDMAAKISEQLVNAN